MSRIEIIAISVIPMCALLIAGLSNEVREQKAAVVAAEAARDQAVKEKQAAEVGLAEAQARKDNVREIIRTVTLPPTGVACSEDPAVRGAYDVVRRLRNDALSADSESPPAGRIVGAVPAAGAHQ